MWQPFSCFFADGCGFGCMEGKLFYVKDNSSPCKGSLRIVLCKEQFLSHFLTKMTAPQFQRNCLTLKGAFGLCELLLKCVNLKSNISISCKIFLKISTYKPPLCKRRWHDEVMTEELFFTQNNL